MKKTRKELFESAKYSIILDFSEPKSGRELVYWLGAHVFTGREDQARLIFSKNSQKIIWSHEEQVECLFYILLTSLRRSNYKDMKKDFWNLYKLCSLKRNSVSRFFLNQGLGLLRYYKGEFAKAFKFSHSAFLESLVIERDYLSMIALDLMGHTQCMLESYSQGIEYFEESLRFAKKIKNNQNSKVIDLSIMTYRIESGVELPRVEKELDQWIESIEIDDYFTKSNALLLKVKIMQLKGSFGEAEQLLNDIGNDVFTLNQGRQILNYNLLMGISRCIVDGPSRCFGLIKTSTKLCNQGQDYYFLHRFKELENYILKEEGKKRDQSGVRTLSYKTGREIKNNYPLAIVPEGFIAELFKREKNYPLSTNKILDLQNKGLLGLIRLGEFYKNREDFIDLTLTNRKILVYLDNNFILVEELTTKQYELIQLLITKERWTRKEIFEQFWQIEYDSFIHDNKIYVTLKRLRERLGAANSIIKLDKGEVVIRSMAHFLNHQKEAKEFLSLSTSDNSFLGEGLNPRQIDFLHRSSPGDIVTPSNYSNQYSVSRNTVSRDLSELVRKGYLKKFGKQKGTFYCRD